MFDFASCRLEPDQTAVLLAGKDTRAAPCLDVESGDRLGRYWFVNAPFFVLLFNKWLDGSVCKNLRELAWILRSPSGPKKGKVTEGWGEKCVTWSIVICFCHHILLRWTGQVDEMGGTCGTHRIHDKCVHNSDLQTWIEETTWDK